MPIAPTDLRDYAKAQGWVLLKEAAKDRLYVMSHSLFERRQLVFPMDTTAPDYIESVTLIVEKLAALEARTPEAVLKSLLEVGDDSISFRVTAQRADANSVPLSFAGSMIAGAQQLLLSSACTVLRPQVHHPRLNRAEPQEFLEKTCFRHTQPGSFVLNVSCPVHAMDVQAPLLLNEVNAPFVRRATHIFRRSLAELVAAIETDSLDELVAELKASKTPLLSSNFCEALTRFEEDSLKYSVDIGISWAASISRPANERAGSVARVQYDYFSRIEEVRRELRSIEKHTDDTFIGTVERLDGEMGGDGQRSGEVILSLLLPEGDQVRVRTHLSAAHYAIAGQAHMTEGTYVKITGRLHPGRQPRQMDELRAFELIHG